MHEAITSPLNPPPGRGPSARRAGRAALALGAVLALYLLFFHRLTDRDLWSSHEARAGMNAQSILEDLRHGRWPAATAGLPRLYDGRLELQKPPLYYWLAALVAHLRGTAVDAAAVRLPSSLAALASVLLVLLWCWSRGRPLAGFLAGVVLATASHFTWLARIGRIDMPLTLAVTAAVLAFVTALSRPRPGPLLVGYLALAAGIWLKGPIGLVLPVAVLCCYFSLGPRPPGRPPLQLGLRWGVPLVLLLTLPWLLWADVSTEGELGRVFLWHHNVERGLGGSRLRSHPCWLYLPFFLGDFLPWTPFLLAGVVVAFRLRWLGADPEARLGLVWLVVILGVLSCARFKRADYLLPAYPGAALFLGSVLDRWLTRRGADAREARRGLLSPSSAAWLVALVAAGAVLGWLVRVEWLLPREEPGRDYRAFAASIRERAPGPAPVLFFRTEAHALAFRLGRPLSILVEWQDLRAWVSRPGVHHVVMPPGSAAAAAHHLPAFRIEEVVRNTDLAGGWHERPLVLMAIEKTDGPR